MKLLVFCCLLVVALVGYSSAQRHNKEWGKHVKGDVFLFNTTVVMKPSSQIQTRRFEYVSLSRLSYFEAIDLITDNKGAYAKLIGGGPGSKSANIEFTTQPKGGCHFLLLYWGKK